MMQLDGYILVDKSTGLSSFDVIRQIRRTFPEKDPNARRAKFRRYKFGHTGTLDPLATGLLVICVGEATKAAQWLTGVDKEYEVTARVGVVSDSYDSTGTVTESDFRKDRSTQHEDYENIDGFVRVLDKFIGEIEQRPPIYSAIHIDGERAYERARRGESVVMPLRKITISQIEMLEHGADQFRLRVHCSSGTYIRSLIHEIGVELGIGAVMTALRRTQCGSFDLKQSHPLARLSQLVSFADWKPYIYDISTGFPRSCVADISSEAWEALSAGRPIAPVTDLDFCLRPHDESDPRRYALLRDAASGSLAFSFAADGSWHPRRILNLKH